MKIKTKRFLLIINPLFFAVITLLLTFSVNSTVIITLISGALHECGHLIALIKYKAGIKSVTLSFYGMKIIRESEMTLNYKKEIAVSLSGVAVNFLLSAVFLIINAIYENQLFLTVSAVNLILGVFNLLPAGKLDGARALACIMKRRFDLTKSGLILKSACALVIIPVLLLGLYILKTSGNFSLLICCLYIILSSFPLSD
ncbi:MAG: hypothetical protein K5755_00370 [Clostridiales bacterium]|nr:hypothetical protein [Clostridiales bacterium]